MSDHAYGENAKIEPCPYCSNPTYADYVDVGVGFVQCGPYHCENCGASEIGPYDEKRELSALEIVAGWYAPGAEPGSSANVIGGKIVSARTALDTYNNHFSGNPRYEIPGVVEQWWKDQRTVND